MEKRVGDRVKEESTLSPGQDDSLTDFKSPKIEPVVHLTNRIKVLNDKRANKKSTSKGGKSSSGSKKKDGNSAAARQTNDEKAQPSIESSFFRAANIANRGGHTCPLCMKYFNDASAGTAHSKNCATKNKVSTRKLLAAVALQERQGDERIAIGLPAGPFVQPKEKTPRRIREPVSKADPDLQLALALSRSLQENELEQEFEEALLLAVEHQGEEPIVGIAECQRRQTLKNFGFSTSKPVAPGITDGPAKSRRKKHLGPTILQTRSQESRDRLLAERIAEILMGNEAITQVCQQTNSNQVIPAKEPKSVLRSRLLNEIHRTTKRLWDSAQLSASITNFYVEDLGAFVAPAVNRQQEDSANPALKRNGSPMKRDEEDSKPNENLPEVEEIIAAEICDSSKNCANEITENLIVETRNIYVTDRQYRNSLPSDWSNTLNVSSMSDLVVIVKNNHIWAHKLVFHVRCANILLDCEPNEDAKFAHVKERVSWPDVDFITGLAFLEFVYSGIIENNSHVFEDNRVAAGVRRLARKYRIKDLFDYLRKRNKEIDTCRDVESRRQGLSSPIVVDANEMRSEIENLRSNEVRENHVQNNHTEGNKIHEIRIEDGTIRENHIHEKINENHINDGKIKENHIQNDKPEENRAITADIEESSSRFSPYREHVELSVKKSNVSQRKIGDERELEIIDVISVSSSRRASTTSPDLFDETIRKSERIDDDETTEKITQLSTEENSNLRELAQLIADDDSSSGHASQEFTPPTSIESQIENKIPEIFPLPEPIQDYTSDQSSGDSSLGKIKISKNLSENKIKTSASSKQINDYRSLSQGCLETPRSRGIIVETSRINEHPRSQRLPEKQKSNLTLFIEKVQRINSKAALDSYTEDESLEGPVDRQRFRNPFDVNNASNRSILNCDEEKNHNSPEGIDQGVGEKNVQLENPEKNNHDESLVDKLTSGNENYPTRLDENDEELSSMDDTVCTDDEDISMYSKYKKINKHNNSIAKYRSILKKLSQGPGERRSEKVNENEASVGEASVNENAIDLTQESDEDSNVPASSSSSVHPPNHPRSMNRILDTDSNGSLLSTKKNRQVKLTTVVENSDSSVSENGVKNCSESSLSSSPLLKRITRRKKAHSMSSSDEDLEKKVEESTVEEKISLDLSDLDVFGVDEEIFSHKSPSLSKDKTLSPSSSCFSPAPRKSDSSRGTRNPDETTKDGSCDNLEANKRVEDYVTVESSQGTKSSRNSLDYPDSDVFEVNEEIFTQSMKNSHQSPCRTPSPRLHFPRKSSRGKRRAVKTRSKDSSFEDLTEDEGQKYTDNTLSQGRKTSKSSPEYPYLDVSQRNGEIFTRSLKNFDNSPQRTLTPSPRHEADLPRKSTSCRCKGRSDEKRTRDNSGEDEETEQYCTDGFSPDVRDPRTSPDHPDLDFFHKNNEIFTQSFKDTDESRGRLTPLSSRSTLRVSSPISITSSSELDANFDGHLATNNERESNKENALERNVSPVHTRQSREEAAERFSPLFLEELQSPRPGTNRPGCSSRRDRDLSNSVKKLMSRSISMPESTSNSENNRRRTKTLKKSSRLTMSQELTPPMNYDDMTTPELKRELEKYGVKPQKRKRARQLLNHIYNELHPVVPSRSSKTNLPSNIVEESDDEEHPSKKIAKINDRASSGSESDREIPLSQYSVTSQTSVIPEEMEYPDADMSPKEDDGPLSIKEAFTELMEADKSLHNKVLTYEPLPLELLHLMLKAEGFKFKKNDLMDFLDEECITFQVLGQLGKSRTKKTRGKKGSKRREKSKPAENLDSV